MKRCFLLLCTITILGLWMIPGWSQSSMTHVPTDGFEVVQRPAAVFVHDEHNALAGVTDCWVCHHMDGEPDPDQSSEGIPCSSCHPETNPDGTPLMQAYHEQCKGCHEQEGKGPLACGQCHVQNGG